MARDPPPPNSGIRGNNVLISFGKAGHVVPTPSLVRVNCSVTIEAAKLLKLGAVSDIFQFYPSLFLRSCFYCNYCCSVFLLFFLLNSCFSISQKYDVTVRNLKKIKIPDYFDLHTLSNRSDNVTNLLKPSIFQVRCSFLVD